MAPQLPPSLDALALEVAARFLDDHSPELSDEHFRQLRTLYQQSLLKVFQEVVHEPEWLAPWHAMKIATRAHALTFGDAQGQVFHSVDLEPTRSVKGLSLTLEKLVGKDMLVLRRIAPEHVPVPVAAPVAPRPAPVPVPAVVAAVAAAPSPAAPKLESPMSPTPGEPKLTDKLSNEATEAAWLIFAAKSVELTQQSMASFFQRNLADGDPAMRTRIGQLMETKMGEVITALLLSGVASTFGNTLSGKVGISPERMEALSSKLRVHAMISGGSSLLDELVDPLVASLSEVIRSMPELNVATPAAPPLLINPAREPEAQAAPVAEKEKVA